MWACGFVMTQTLEIIGLRLSQLVCRTVLTGLFLCSVGGMIYKTCCSQVTVSLMALFKMYTMAPKVFGHLSPISTCMSLHYITNIKEVFILKKYIPRRSINGCPLLRVCVQGLCVCTWMGKCRARIPSMGHRTWLYVMSLSLFKRGQYDFFFFFRQFIYFFIQQGCIILTKSDWIYLCCCKSAVNFKWFIHQRILKKSIIILNRTTVFNTDYNKKCVLSIKLAYQNYFWRIMWHWRLEYWLLKNHGRWKPLFHLLSLHPFLEKSLVSDVSLVVWCFA